MKRLRGGAPGSVRIIAGQWRGSRLPVPTRSGLRPSSDRVRETLFNWLAPVLRGARCLDLFAGSGALGFEAASRGAAQVLLVERDPELAAGLRSSAARLAAGQVEIRCADALAVLEDGACGPFDVVFIDPPFAEGAWDAVLQRLPERLAAEAWIHLESPADHAPAVPADWRLHREGRTREVRHALYHRPARPG